MLKQGMYELLSLVILYVPGVCWGRDFRAPLQLGTGVFFFHLMSDDHNSFQGKSDLEFLLEHKDAL